MIIITKSFEYQGDATGKDLGSTIFVDDGATVTVEGEEIFKVNLFLIITLAYFLSKLILSLLQIYGYSKRYF